MPAISVIVPVYKVEPYIRRCIDSILSQTFTDFELILVDDGSPDNCPAICDEYALKDNRVHVIHQQNRGLSAARNTGLDYIYVSSDSEWISFVDSDDWVHLQYLEYLYNSAKDSNAQASVCLYSLEDECVLKERFKHLDWQSYSFEDFFCYKKTGLNSIVAWGKLYNKKLFQDKRFPIGKINEDLYVTPMVLSECNRVAIVEIVLYYYFQSINSIMRRPWNIHRLDEIEGSKKLIDFLKDKRLYKAETVAIERYFWVIGRQRDEIKTLPKKNNIALRFLDINYKNALFRYRNFLSSEMFRYKFEKEYPRLTWCYWTCVGIIGKIKRMVKKNA